MGAELEAAGVSDHFYHRDRDKGRPFRAPLSRSSYDERRLSTMVLISTVEFVALFLSNQ
jgi:hypothetical protein